MSRRLTAAVAAAAALALSSCAIADTAPDQKGLVYNHGPFEATTFHKCVDPSTKEWQGYDDQVFTYPAGQRTYMFDTAEGSDTGPLTAPTRDNITLTITGLLAFELNTDCEVLQKFHERIGMKDDWETILRTYLEQPLNRAVTEATQEQDWLPVYTDPARKAEWERKVLDLLPGFVKQATGGEYFRNFTLTLQKPKLPAELEDALLRTQKAIEDTKAQTEENKRLASVVDGTRAQIEMLGADNYVLLKAIESGKVSFMPVPDGSPVMVAPR